LNFTSQLQLIELLGTAGSKLWKKTSCSEA